ncbi:uracil permease [Carnobacterium sp. TMP28]|uniref:uracil permease n=1 Tax=Carnobacterium sp. TMP28 TaxID=3397060 RepID=UPI0039E0E23E
MSKKNIIQVDEKVPVKLLIPLSLQHTFAMFGASVLVPIIFGIDPSIVLLMNGLSTLLFIFITKGKAPAYLGSSFAFIGPTSIIIANQGFQYAQGAFVVLSLIGCLLALFIHRVGTEWIAIVLPPAAMGAVVALIGLELASNTVNGGTIGANLMTDTATPQNFIIFFITLGVAVLGSVLFKGFLSTIPILISIVVGYVSAIAFGMVDFTPVLDASLFTMPHFQWAKFDFQSILTMLPVLLVLTSEHIGHQVVTSNVIGRDLMKEPGLHRSLFADYLASAISGLIGGVPTTTYGENIGVMAITRVYSVRVIAGAAIFSIFMAFIGPLAALISTIPGDVIGGVTFLLYGMIGTSGLRLLVESKVDYGQSRNLILTSIVFVAGLSGLTVNFAGIELKGMILASVVGIILSISFYLFDKLGWMNE